MQNYADYASELVERIDAGDLEPSEVDIRPFVENEHDVLTPALRDRLEGSGKLQEYNARVRERDHAELADQQADKQQANQEALDAISDPTLEETATVTLNDTDLQVKNYVNGAIERKLLKIQQAERGGADAVDVAREATIDVITWLIEAPEEYTNPEVWREYAERFGTPELQRRAIELAEPYRDRQEELSDVDSFRGDTSG